VSDNLKFYKVQEEISSSITKERYETTQRFARIKGRHSFDITYT
jgi:hypothetical protein